MFLVLNDFIENFFKRKKDIETFLYHIIQSLFLLIAADDADAGDAAAAALVHNMRPYYLSTYKWSDGLCCVAGGRQVHTYT